MLLMLPRLRDNGCIPAAFYPKKSGPLVLFRVAGSGQRFFQEVLLELIWNKARADAEVLILSHGAGAGMDSDFMERMANLLCQAGITVVRFEFDYRRQRRETGSKRPPDRQPKLLLRI